MPCILCSFCDHEHAQTCVPWSDTKFFIKRMCRCNLIKWAAFNVLCLVSSALSATTSTLKLASLGANNWLGVAVWYTRCQSKVLVCLASFAGTLHQNSALSLWSPQSQLVKGDDLPTGLDDAGTSPLSDAQSTHLQFGNLVNAYIISDGPNDHSNLVLTPLRLHHADQF